MDKIINIVCLGLVNTSGQIFLVKKGREPFAGTRGIPGGKIHYGEKIIDALSREMQEEIGYIVKDPFRVGVFEFFDLGHIIVHAYYEQIPTDNYIFMCCDDEIIEGKRFDLLSISIDDDIDFTPNHRCVISCIQQTIKDNSIIVN